MKRAILGLAVLLAGCSLEGQQIKLSDNTPCMGHEIVSLTGNVSFAECRPKPGTVLVQGSGTGWAEPASKAVAGLATGAGIGVAGALLPSSFSLTPP